MEFSEKTKQKRLQFAENIRSMGIDRCVFLGWNKLNEATLWCAVTNLRVSSIQIDYGGIHSGYYTGFLDETVLPIYNSLSNVTFVHIKSRLSRSNLVRNWMASHPNIKFVEWPLMMKENYPLNNVWPYFKNDNLEDEADIYERWEMLKEDLNDFRHVYNDVKSQIRKIVWSRGEQVESDSDGESGISDGDREG